MLARCMRIAKVRVSEFNEAYGVDEAFRTFDKIRMHLAWCMMVSSDDTAMGEMVTVSPLDPGLQSIYIGSGRMCYIIMGSC